ALALDPVVRPGQRLAEIVRDVLVELEVLVVGDLAARTRPKRLRLIDALRLTPARAQLHGESDVVGILANEPADAERIAELVRIAAQEQLHGRADIVLRPAFDRELALSVGLPGDARLGGLARLAAFDLDP